MMPDDRQHQPERVQRLTNVLPGDGMELHHFPLRRSQVTPFLQNLVGHGDLSQVMEIPTALQRKNGIFIHTQMPPQFHRMHRQPLAMPLGVRIASFNNQPERAQYRIGRLQFVGKLFYLQQGTNASEQFLGPDRLRQKIIRAGFDSLEALFVSTQAGDQDNRDQPRSRIFFQLAAQFIAGFAGHDHIEQNEVWSLARDLNLRLGRIVRSHCRIAAAGQQILHHRRVDDIVVNHQNFDVFERRHGLFAAVSRWFVRAGAQIGAASSAGLAHQM